MSGAPLKLTPAVHEAIIESLLGGNYVTTACRAAGINPKTYYEWLNRSKDDPECPAVITAFVAEAEAALAESELRLVKAIQAASIDDWRAAAFLIERRHPKRWNEKTEQKVTASVGVKLDDIDKIRKTAEQNECEPPKTTKGEPNS